MIALGVVTVRTCTWLRPLLFLHQWRLLLLWLVAAQSGQNASNPVQWHSDAGIRRGVQLQWETIRC